MATLKQFEEALRTQGMHMALAILEKKASVQQLLKSWFFSYIGNILGCLLLVTAVQQTGLLAQAAAPGKMSVVKTSLTTAQVGLLAADDSSKFVCPTTPHRRGHPP